MNQMKYTTTYTSKVVGRVLSLLLLIDLTIFAAIACFTAFYAYSYDTYAQYLASIDQTLMSFGSILYIILVIVFLIWLVRVHAAIKERHADYPINTFGAIVRMLPIVNIWGIGSTFSNIGNYFNRHEALHRHANFILKMIVPLYIFIFVERGIDRHISRNPLDVSDEVVFIGSLINASTIVVYYIMTRTINSGIYQLVQLQDISGDHKADLTDHPSSDTTAPPLS